MTFPTDKFKQISVEQVTDTRIPELRYFRNRARGNKAPFFMLVLTTPPLPYAEYMRVSAQIERYENGLEIFNLPHPLPSIGAFGSLPAQSASAGDKVFDLDVEANYQVGDFISFIGHGKVYRIADVQINTGTTKVWLTCPLVSDVAQNESVIYGSNVSWSVATGDSFVTEINADNGKFGVVEVELVEQG